VTSVDPALRRYYAARAREYDRVYEKPERQTDLLALQRWLPSRFQGAHLLEIACGTGYWTKFIAPVAAEIVAIDAAPETLEIARARVHDATVRFLVGDAYRLPVELGAFDAALAAFWFSHVPVARQRELLSGLSAVLGRGAAAVLVDNRYVEGSSTPVCERDQDGNTYQLRQLDDGSSHRILKNFPTEAELRSLTAGLGEHFRYTAFDYYWAVEYEALGT
jgi:demethylmenaquinone methyltransferase/2-methoxy-6-polyprenyl-1,4-benzoquinol methylase